MTYIREVEFNFTNTCPADCAICADPHGRPIGESDFKDNKLMSTEVFNLAVEQLKEIEFDVIQTSGNGDAFMNPNYFNFLRILRSEFPKAEIHFYSSFAIFTRRRADMFIQEELIDKLFTRIDSLNPEIFKKSTGLSFSVVDRNIKYFISKNKKIKFTIGYASIPEYYSLCKDILGRKPNKARFTDEEISAMGNEYQAIKSRYSEHNVHVESIGQSLWAERTNVEPDEKTLCPKRNFIKNTLWISPNGTLDACGYDDEQCKLVYGSIFDDTIKNHWEGKTREVLISRIFLRQVTEYPCINPQCCKLYKGGRLHGRES